ncbi:transcription elongation factor elongin B isoform X1 [Rhodnius prolixus]
MITKPFFSRLILFVNFYRGIFMSTHSSDSRPVLSSERTSDTPVNSEKSSLSSLPSVERGIGDVFLMIRRKKLSIFTDATDNTSVLELKRIIEGILKVPPENQQLFNKDNQLMDDDKTLQDYGMVASVAKAQCPATVGLAIRMENGEFEKLDIAPLSSPPDLPYVMKSQETNGQEQTS